MASEQRKTEVRFFRGAKNGTRATFLQTLVPRSLLKNRTEKLVRAQAVRHKREWCGRGRREEVDGVGKERQLVHLLFKTLKRFRSHPESRLNSLSRAKIS